MQYKLIITERAEVLLDSILNYIINRLKNSQAGGNLLTEIEHVVQKQIIRNENEQL